MLTSASSEACNAPPQQLIDAGLRDAVPLCCFKLLRAVLLNQRGDFVHQL